MITITMQNVAMRMTFEVMDESISVKVQRASYSDYSKVMFDGRDMNEITFGSGKEAYIREFILITLFNNLTLLNLKLRRLL